MGLWRQCWVGARGTKKSWRNHLFLLESSDFIKREVKEGDGGANHFMGDFFSVIIFCGHFSIEEMPPLLLKHDLEGNRLHGTCREVAHEDLWEAWCLDSS